MRVDGVNFEFVDFGGEKKNTADCWPQAELRHYLANAVRCLVLAVGL